MIVQDRDQSRRVYINAWGKYVRGAGLDLLEQLVVTVTLHHPQFHAGLADPTSVTADDGPGEQNPFLHMGMHIAMREQIQTDRPSGVTRLYRRLCALNPDEHALHHRMMTCLEEVLQRAGREHRPPDDSAYLACLEALG